jgi:hypothetical protein
MDKDQTKLEPQEAPLKNTDKAFVRVDKDGKPLIPGKDEKKDEAERINENEEEGRP